MSSYKQGQLHLQSKFQTEINHCMLPWHPPFWRVLKKSPRMEGQPPTIRTGSMSQIIANIHSLVKSLPPPNGFSFSARACSRIDKSNSKRSYPSFLFQKPQKPNHKLLFPYFPFQNDVISNVRSEDLRLLNVPFISTFVPRLNSCDSLLSFEPPSPT